MSIPTQKNIEIYARATVDQVVAWLHKVIGPVTPDPLFAPLDAYQCSAGIVFLRTGIGDGSFTEVYFCKSGDGPWATDVDFARAASPGLACLVHCDPGAYYPNIHPASDIFLQVDGDSEKLILITDDHTWKDA
jgi:hypothetical protein